MPISFSTSDDGRKSPLPSPGSFRPEDDSTFDAANHMDGFNRAIARALQDYGDSGRDVGQIDQVAFVLTARVERTNPGNVIEYLATLI